jgi:hypothetical protein
MSRLNVDKITGATGTASGAPITLSGDTATLGSGVAMAANHSGVKTALNASGTAPIYACRAWVNFNGTGTVAIRDSGNVSSITDRGTGLYRINLTTDMPDENYSFVASTSRDTSTSQQITQIDGTTFTTSACAIRCMDTGNTDRDAHFACIAILR